MSGDKAGTHRAFQKVRGNGVKIAHFLIQCRQDAHFLKFRDPCDVQTRHVRQRVGLSADEDLVMEVRPLVRDGVDLNPGVLLLKFGDENIHKSFVLSGLCAVVMPEIDRNGFGFRSRCRRFLGRFGGLSGAGAGCFFGSARSECR